MNVTMLLRSIQVLLVLAALLMSTPASGTSGEVFLPAAEADCAFSPADPGGLVLRQRFVKVDLARLIIPPLRGKPDILHDPVGFNLFPGLQFDVQQYDMQRAGHGKTRVWTGRIVGSPRSSVTLAMTGSIVAGKIRTEHGDLFDIRYAGNGVHAIRQIDVGAFPPEHAPRIPPADSLPARADAPVVHDDGSIIDVMVVFTPKVLTTLGSLSAVQSEIALAESETNQGYANSGVEQRIRVVHTSQIAYDERVGFEDALYDLTNNDDGQMDAVHEWRETHGADMVSLWIDNMTYCGIAWLMTSTTQDFASRAFSVVSIDCATGYFTFAHEMGHNQGCHHDRANASGAGVFPYSYGYQHRDAPSFRTIMSYDCPGGCTRINHWSNPDVSYQGLPTGVDASSGSSANNALSLNNTRTIAANWKNSTGTPPPPQASTQDIVWRNVRTGRNSIWFMQGTSISLRLPSLDIKAPWRAVGVADFDGDGKADLLWRHPEQGTVTLMYMEGVQRRSNDPFPNVKATPPWELVGVGNFNDDHWVDLVWHHPITGKTVLMLMVGATPFSRIDLGTVKSPWQISAVGDINNDDSPDLIWRNPALGRTVFWLMDGIVKSQSVVLDRTIAAPWTIRGVADFDGDGKADLLWRNPQLGRNTVMSMDGTTILSTARLPDVAGNVGWGIVGVGHFD